MQSAEQDVYTVSEINAEVCALVEGEYPSVSVLGEVSNFRRHSSGHLYFSLKDERSQLSAVCFRGDARRVDADVADGMKVLATGKLTVYDAYGKYQLVARDIREAGEGDLERAYRELLARLREEGLFEEAHKKALPPYPIRIAVVTSPTGAAIRDVLSTLRRRWPCAEVLVVPVRVQGETAGAEIEAALDRLALFRDIDAIIVGRGGGSLEDLWAFNEERVARAIHRCPIPVISAVGHESDYTIADHVADVRAATPTMAAELAAPRADDVAAYAASLVREAHRHVAGRLERRRGRLDELLRSYALGKVRGMVEGQMQRLDYAVDRSRRALRTMVATRGALLDARLATLSALDPTAILGRGYTICAQPESGRVLRGVGEARSARRMRVRFHDGDVLADVEEDTV